MTLRQPSGGPATILVAVITFRRPGLVAQLVDVLSEQVAQVPGARCLVLDNDPLGSSSALREHPAVRRGQVTYEQLGAGDVVSARNATIERAVAQGVDDLVLLDDDELPGPSWLASLVRTRQRCGGDVVAGPVRQAAAALPPHAAALLARADRPSGPFSGDVGAGNVLISVDLLRSSGLRFDPRLGSSGGEDTLFFRAAAKHGATFCWAADAVVTEHNDPSRLTRAALLRRSLANGRASVVVDEALGTATSRGRRLAVMLGAAAVHGSAAAALAVRGRPVEAWRRTHKVARHVGRVLGPVDHGAYGGGRTTGEQEDR